MQTAQKFKTTATTNVSLWNGQKYKISEGGGGLNQFYRAITYFNHSFDPHG